MPERRVLREIVCKSTEFAQRHGREGIKLMGQKFFDMHESSRLNMSFKCSGEFNLCWANTWFINYKISLPIVLPLFFYRKSPFPIP